MSRNAFATLEREAIARDDSIAAAVEIARASMPAQTPFYLLCIAAADAIGVLMHCEERMATVGGAHIRTTHNALRNALAAAVAAGRAGTLLTAPIPVGEAVESDFGAFEAAQR